VTGTPLPFEAIAGKVLSDTGELIAVVTILHDRSEALERARTSRWGGVGRTRSQVAATGELARRTSCFAIGLE
jgi:hypothetical protein